MGDERTDKMERDLELIRERFVEYIRSDYGTSEEGLRDFFATMRWMKIQRETYKKVSRFIIWPTAALIVTMIVTGAAAVFVKGLAIVGWK